MPNLIKKSWTVSIQGVGLGNSFVPCTPLAVLKILQNCIPNPDFMGKNACVVGRSHNVGLPIAMILQADHVKGILFLDSPMHSSPRTCEGGQK